MCSHQIGVAIVNYYHLYIMDFSGNHIENFEEISAKSHIDAIKMAEKFSEIREKELWNGDLFIHKFQRYSDFIHQYSSSNITDKDIGLNV